MFLISNRERRRKGGETHPKPKEKAWEGKQDEETDNTVYNSYKERSNSESRKVGYLRTKNKFQ